MKIYDISLFFDFPFHLNFCIIFSFFIYLLFYIFHFHTPRHLSLSPETDGKRNGKWMNDSVYQWIMTISKGRFALNHFSLLLFCQIYSSSPACCVLNHYAKIKDNMKNIQSFVVEELWICEVYLTLSPAPYSRLQFIISITPQLVVADFWSVKC